MAKKVKTAGNKRIKREEIENRQVNDSKDVVGNPVPIDTSKVFREWRDKMLVSVVISSIGLMVFFHPVVGIIWFMLTGILLFFYVKKHKHNEEFLHRLASGDHHKSARRMFHYTGSITTFIVFGMISYLFAIQDDVPVWNPGTIVTGIIAVLGLVWLIYAVTKRH